MSISMSDLKSFDDEQQQAVNKHMPLKKTFRSLVNINQDSNYSAYKFSNKNQSSNKTHGCDCSKLLDNCHHDVILENKVSKTIDTNIEKPDSLISDNVITDKTKSENIQNSSILNCVSSSFEGYENSDNKNNVNNELLFHKKEETTKTHWLKGQLHNYISKSKEYYNKRLSLDGSDQLHKDDQILNSFKILQNTSEVNFPLSLSTMTTDESHLPLLETSQHTYRNEKSSKSRLFKNQNSSQLRNQIPPDQPPTPKKDKIDNSKAPKSPRLTFSELLSSQNKTVTQNTENSGVVPAGTTNKDLFMSSLEINALTELCVHEDLKDNLYPQQTMNVSFYQLFGFSLIMFAYMMSFYPKLLSGIFTGALISYLYCCFSIIKLCPSIESIQEYRKELKFYFEESAKVVEGINRVPKPEVLLKPKDLKGWLQVADTYWDYLLEKSNLKDAYVAIHENTLYIFMCQYNILGKSDKPLVQPKRNNKGQNGNVIDQDPAFLFEHEYHFDLSKCCFELKPDDLPMRRLWNKKYPMKFSVPIGEFKKRKIKITLEELTSNLNDVLNNCSCDNNKNELILNTEEELFYLFVNTGREKEFWFYRIQLSVFPLKHQVTFDDIKNKCTLDQPAKSYPYYMVELITESEHLMQKNINGKKVEPHLAWLNVFLGRAFWDFWHDNYWIDKLHQKIQSRLSKISTPPFIMDIKLTELNCGHNIPIIHKGSLPVLDEYGVWSDLQVSYKGSFTLTLETQLNVDYYSGLISGIVKENCGNTATKMSDISNDFEDGNENDSVYHDEIPDVYLDAFDSHDSSLEADTTVMSDPRTKAFLESNPGKRLVGLVSWLAKSKIAKRVAETEFAKKAYTRVCEKFRKMPIILRVEIQSLKGNLAVNLPPPPSNRLWFGFRGNPAIFISASPKVGEKQVRLNYLTSWIEKKLKEEFKKYLVLPAMQDFSIKLMDHQLREIYPDRPSS
ncbi:testis-expressed protein 2 isoform X2 [Hydra vulgaris]|uniref:Testis-expressed protein 2 isoform X2 n=1 Tax=Hydra vulgaris TaxID=6087 RepID=A0ABM4CA36_HYDVU